MANTFVCAMCGGEFEKGFAAINALAEKYGFAYPVRDFEYCPWCGRKLTKRALDACPRCDGEGRIWQADLSSKDTCYACRGTGKRQ